MDAPASRSGRLIGLPLLVMLAALLGGGLFGFGVASIALRTSGGEGFADLAAFLLGMMAAAVVTAVAWVIGIAVLSRRVFAPGQRMLPVAFSLGFMAVGAVVWFGAMFAVNAAPDTPAIARVIGFLGLALLLASGSLGFWLAERRRGSSTA